MLIKLSLKLKYLFIILIIFIIIIYNNNIINEESIYNEKNYKNIKSSINLKLDDFYIIKDKLELTNSLIKIYSDLYDYSRDGYTKPKFSKLINDYSNKQKFLNICICSIAKNENLYVKEFVEYYKNLGIDKIFLYDNNDIEGEKFDKILSDYIKNIIIVINI